MSGVTRRAGRRVLALVLGLVLLGVLGSACGAGGSGGSGAAGSAQSSSGDRAAVVGGGSAAAPGVSGTKERNGTSLPGAARPTVQTRAVIRTGSVAVVTAHLERARARVEDLIGRYGGYVADERSARDHSGHRAHVLLRLRVPSSDFTTVLSALRALGREQHSRQRAEDVATQVIDVDARVRTQRASLARLRALMKRADNVDDMIRVESEIATRQATLESLEAQQAYLREQTTMATISLRLTTPAGLTPGPVGTSGFLDGLRSGWHALTAFLLTVATVLGAVLPFGVAAAAVAVPVWWLLRRLARRRQARQPAPPAPAS